jgi:hypothetical protein
MVIADAVTSKDTSLALDARPRLAFRVGVTGHRDLVTDLRQLEETVARVLDVIESEMKAVSSKKNTKDLYADLPPLLQLVSPLAEGADRLVARLAVLRAWQLAALLPFISTEYEKDFPETTSEFRDLLAVAETAGQLVELDGRRSDEKSAYHEVGRFVLRCSDLVVAIWDGASAKGVGGTAQIVADSLAMGIPVIHIEAAPPHAVRFLKSAANDSVFASSEYARELQELIDEIAAPRAADTTTQRQQLSASREYLTGEHLEIREQAPNFLGKGPYAKRSTVLSRVFPSLVRVLAGSTKNGVVTEALPPPAGKGNPTVRNLYLHYYRADTLATYYANIHRSAFVLIYLLGSIAVIAAIAMPFLDGFSTAAVLTEFASLCGIFALVKAERHYRWRERWLDYRLMAEMLREADLLAQIGGCLPHRGFERIAQAQPNRAWVFWLVAAISRASGIVGLRYDANYVSRVLDYAIEARLADQIAYHLRTEARNKVVGRRLTLISEALFFCTVAAVLVKLLFPTTASFLAGLFPALAGASFGIRNQAEFEIVVRRSSRLHNKLVFQRDRIKNLGQRLSAGSLRQEILRAARIMRDDAADWAAIFEVKESDTA